MITLIDMHLRDMRLLKYLSKHDNERIPAHVMASVMDCHENTILAMVSRLESADHIQVIRNQKKGGNIYRINTAKTKCS